MSDQANFVGSVANLSVTVATVHEGCPTFAELAIDIALACVLLSLLWFVVSSTITLLREPRPPDI